MKLIDPLGKYDNPRCLEFQIGTILVWVYCSVWNQKKRLQKANTIIDGIINRVPEVTQFMANILRVNPEDYWKKLDDFDCQNPPLQVLGIRLFSEKDEIEYELSIDYEYEGTDDEIHEMLYSTLYNVAENSEGVLYAS